MQVPLVIGTFGNTKYSDLQKVVDTGLDCGIKAFDTAPSYGTERMLGKALRNCSMLHHITRENLFVSDKVDAWQMQRSNGDVRFYVEKAIKEMNIQYLDILFVHWPVEEYLQSTWDSMQKMKEDGLVKDIGICNVRKRHLEKWKKLGIDPKFVQIERHPLRTCQDDMQYCKEQGITVFSYSPLCRMHPKLKESPLLREIAEKYGKNIGQVILRWHIDSGTTPVFMSKNPQRIKQNVDLFDFSLSKEEIKKVDGLDCNYKIFLESWGCPGF